jgi:hypothetical protein
MAIVPWLLAKPPIAISPAPVPVALPFPTAMPLVPSAAAPGPTAVAWEPLALASQFALASKSVLGPVVI